MQERGTEEPRPREPFYNGARSELLVQFGMFALTERELEPLMTKATELVASALGVELSSVLETAPSGDRFVRRASVGFRAPPEPAFLPNVAGLGAYAMTVKAPVVVVDLARETRFACPALAREGVVSGLCVLVHGRCESSRVPYGCLFAGSREVHAFNQDDVAFLENASNIIGSSIHRWRMEERLRKSEERFDLLSNSMRDGALLYLAPDGGIAGWNAPAERLFGWRDEEVVGKHVSGLGEREDAFRGIMGELLRRVVDERQVSAEVWLQRRDGTRFRADVVLLALQGEADALRGTALIVRDVTARFFAESERARLTAKIEEQRDILHTIIDQFPAGVVVASAVDGTIKLINRKMKTLRAPSSFGELGSIAELADHFPVWFPDCRRLRTEDYSIAHGLRGEAIRQELLFERADGTIGTLLASAEPIVDRNGRVDGSVAAIYDISDEKERMRERERLLEEAHRAVRARDDILAVVSHDLRNPAGVIALAASELEHCGDTVDATKVRTCAGRIHRAAEGIEQIIGDLLDFSHIEMGRLVVEPSEQSAGDVVAEAIDAFAGLAAQRGIQVRATLDGLAGVRLFCDRGRIVQVLSNLIGNALKFVARGHGIDVGGHATDRDVILHVHDEGPGVRPEHLPHVFDRYWQSDARDARRGLGLGLAIVKGIVDAHGGQVWVESPPGQGATFAFSLPLTTTG